MSVSITFRCPDDIAAYIQSQVETTGKDKTSVLVGMLRQSLQVPLEERHKLLDDYNTVTSYNPAVLDKNLTKLLDNRIEQALESFKSEMRSQLEAQLGAQLSERLGKLKAR